MARKKIICDAFFERNGYTYIIEIDNTRKMIDNKKNSKIPGDVVGDPQTVSKSQAMYLYKITKKKKDIPGVDQEYPE